MRIKEIPKEAILIEDTIDDYVDPYGNIYGYNHRNNQPVYPYKKEQQENNGYMYVPINYVSGRKTKRVHRVVAEAFIPNPDNLPIVMHKDNNKKNNCVNNLKWGTISENTKQAYEDNLAENNRGFDDSQSIPCDMYRTSNNELIECFGSYREAERVTGITIGTIRWQINHPEAPIKKAFYFTAAGEGPREHTVIAQYNFTTDEQIRCFSNCAEASRITGVREQTINTQVNKENKPKWSKSGFYFKRILLKCEETIEI